MIEEIAEEFGQKIVHWSAARFGGEKIISDIMDRLNVKKAVEIGTHLGLTSLIMSKHCEKLYTFDCWDYEEKYQLWKRFGAENIRYYTVPTDKEKGRILSTLEFDFAFVDGDHREGVVTDFNFVKHCGRVLFHDANSASYAFVCVKNLVDSLPQDEITKIDNFALWERK